MFSVSFNGFNLSSITDVSLYNYEFNNLPTRQLRSFKLANQDRSALTTADYMDKRITVNFHIIECTREAAEVALLELRRRTQAIKGTLSVSQYNRTVTYTATLEAMTERWVANNMDVVMTFYCNEPLGTDSVTETLIDALDTNTTTAPTDFEITLNGSSYHQFPIITVTVNSVTDGTDGTMSIMNSGNSDEVEITRDWASSDVLEINTFLKTVKVNGTEVDYSGKVPDFEVGTTDITYDDDFSARDVDVEAEYNRRYI